MRISSNYSFLNIDSNKPANKVRVSNKLNKNPYSDTFVKSTPAFKGSKEEDSFSTLFDNAFNIFAKEASSFFTKLSDIIRQTRRETEVAAYIAAFSDKSVRKIMLARKKDKLATINLNVFQSFNFDIEFINKLFENANIKSILALDAFIRTYNCESGTRKVFKGQEIEAVKIYGFLNCKDNLSKFPELLLYLYNQEADSQNSDYTKLDKTADFLKRVGVLKFNDFDKKFSFLSPRFNDFETISDKVDAIEYLQTTYDDKMALLADIIKQSGLPQNVVPEKIYASATDIIEYFYEKNNGENLNGIEEIIDYIALQGKLKTQSLKQISSSYNDFKNPENKVDFFKFLKDCNVSISDFNVLSSKPIISDVDIKEFLSNKEMLSQYISKILGVREFEGNDYYKKFRDIINALYDESKNSEFVKSFIELSDRFNFKNSDSLLQLYNRTLGIRKCSITSQELRDFIDLFRYSDSQNIFVQAKAQNISAIDLLTREKEQFLSIKGDIDNFIYSDDTAFFAGQSALEIYKKYRKLLLENKENVQSILQNIVEFDVQNANQYSQKALQVKPFTKFFKDKESMLLFFTENDIKFDDSDEDTIYRKNCIEIFDALYDEDDKEMSFERINYIAKSGFLVKSQAKLTEFLLKMSSKDTRRKVMSIIADKKIPSISSLEKFFKQYRLPNSKGAELLEYLQNLPADIDFSKSIELLNSIQEKIDSLNIPIQINSSNINSINLDEINSKKSVSATALINILDDMSCSTDDANFIVSLPGATKNVESNTFSPYRIAQEIASKIDKSGESYQNISRLLGIDRVSLSLPRDCSYYFYVKAIEQALPKQFVDFVNSDEWLKFSNDEVCSANLVLHARLRAIDRFALNDADNIDVLYKDETISKLKDLLKTVYTTSPIDIKGADLSKRFVADFVHGSNVIEAVFLNNGEMITIVPKRNSNKA